MIKERLDTKYSTVDFDKYVTNYENDDLHIPDNILTVGIIVSYDMVWQKRSTGRIYDSLSGHGFIIGCSTGKVVALAVREKNVRNVRLLIKRYGQMHIIIL